MAAIDGLASGLNTTQIIQQLMQIERMPQARLQSTLKLNDKAIDALQFLNTKFLAVKTASEALTKPTGWQPATASSSNEAIATATASAGAKPATLAFNVTQLAAAGSAISSGTATATTDVVASGTTIDVTKGGETRTIDVGDGSLASVAKAINDEKMGVTATAVKVADGSYKLQLSSTTTGAATGISVNAGAFTADTLGDMAELTAAQDATLEVGTTNPYTVTRASNTFSDLLDGVTITLKATGTTTVTVEGDTEAMTASVKGLIDGANAALEDIRARTSYNTTTNKGAILTGDSMLRGLQGRLLGAFSAGTTVNGTTYSAADFGITIERDGTIKLDEAKFAAAYEKDPAVAEAVLGANGGLADRLHAVADLATRPAKSTTDVGLITGAIKAREDERTQLNKNIASWDNRLEIREQTLLRQFTALERAMAQAQSQGQWLAGQLAGLQANAPQG
jgi:flagellar hook-associated protein 2